MSQAATLSGAPKSVVAEPGRRSTTWKSAPHPVGRAMPASAATAAYRSALAARASIAVSSSRPARHHPGQSRAQANTFFLPCSR